MEVQTELKVNSDIPRNLYRSQALDKLNESDVRCPALTAAALHAHKRA